MKLFIYAALVASAFALRMQSGQQTQEAIHAQNTAQIRSLIQAGALAVLQDRSADLEKWFAEEVHSHNGLTWNEFQGRMVALAAEHNYRPSDDDWKKLRDIFDKLDKNGDGTIKPADFVAETK